MTIAVIDTQTPTTYQPPATEKGAVAEEWTLIIRPQRHLVDLHLGELWQARDLVPLFVGRVTSGDALIAKPL